MFPGRTVRFLLAALVLCAGAGRAAAMSTPALVIDVDTGKVLYAERATDPWFPASITKLMTTYVALDLVRQGKASMDQLLTVSADAASEPPSKMGFKPGTTLTLDNALKIIMVKSANDIAYAIGENLGGSVDGFAALMNDTSRRLGMRESRWFNPHGLPDDRQQTSARDMAILGRALLRDFPEHKELFSISAIQFGRRVMANHNGLLGRYTGIDGMKTGFICSGGFNVVASATRGGRRLITVVMGSSSAKERTLKAAALFDHAYSQFRWGGSTVDELPPSSLAAAPNMRPIICGGRTPQEDDSDLALAVSAAAAGGNADNANAQLGAAMSAPSAALAFTAMNSASWRGQALPPRAPLQPVLVWTGRDPAESQVAANAAEDAAAARPRRGRRGKAIARTRRPVAPVARTITAPKTKVMAEAPKPKAAAAAAKPVAKVAGKPAKKRGE